jgi:hypothetical protein
MNTETGNIYRTQLDIDAARQRGEPVVDVSEHVADAVEIGMQALQRAERRVIARYGPRKPLREVRAELRAARENAE